MPDFKVSPEVLLGVATNLQSEGGKIETASEQLFNSTIPDLIFGTDYAVNQFSESWSKALSDYAKACDSLSADLKSTADDYSKTDRSQGGRWKS